MELDLARAAMETVVRQMASISKTNQVWHDSLLAISTTSRAPHLKCSWQLPLDTSR